MARYSGFTALAGILLLVLPAQADIGAIGSPFQQKSDKQEAAAPKADDSKADKKDEAKPEVADAASKPLVEINFSQRYVHFDDMVAQAIKAAEKAKPDVVYSVDSYLPLPSKSPRQDARASEEAEKNLRNVVNSIRAQGVPASRIRVSMKPGNEAHDRVTVSVQ